METPSLSISMSRCEYNGLTSVCLQRTHNKDGTYGETTLPSGIRSRFVISSNGLTMHILEAGFEVKGRPRPARLRARGRATDWDDNHDGDQGAFRFLNLVRDAVGLVCAFGKNARR